MIEIGWDLEEDNFSLKIQDILFENFACVETETDEDEGERHALVFRSSIKLNGLSLKEVYIDMVWNTEEFEKLREDVNQSKTTTSV